MFTERAANHLCQHIGTHVKSDPLYLRLNLIEMSGLFDKSFGFCMLSIMSHGLYRIFLYLLNNIVSSKEK